MIVLWGVGGSGGLLYLGADLVRTAKAAGHEAVRARLGVVQLHVPERQGLPAPVAAGDVGARTLSLLVLVDVLGLSRWAKKTKEHEKWREIEIVKVHVFEGQEEGQ